MSFKDLFTKKEEVTEEDIKSLINEGHEQGVLESDEAEMINNIVEMGEKDASDVMIHRKNVVAMDGDMTLQEAVDFMLYEGVNSRYPVYDVDVDNIIGILNLKDAIIASRTAEYPQTKLKNLKNVLRDAHFVPETRSLDNLFKEMQTKKVHMVIVVDEYGQTAGIVTLEDIIEEIVGEIQDEYDVDEKNITCLGEGRFILKGMAELEQIVDECGIEFSEEELENFDTLNGFLIAKLDRIPKKGDKFTVESHGCRFESLNVDDRIIRSVKVTKINSRNGNSNE